MNILFVLKASLALLLSTHTHCAERSQLKYKANSSPKLEIQIHLVFCAPYLTVTPFPLFTAYISEIAVPLLVVEVLIWISAKFIRLRSLTPWVEYLDIPSGISR